MLKMWSWLAVNLGRRAGVVSVVGLVVTIGLGLGITQLDFATGQDSYLNSDEQVAVDNVAYQDLFGGQAMITMVTMDDGATVDELFTTDNIASIAGVAEEIRSDDGVLGVISPLTALEFSTSLVTAESGNPFDAIASRALLHAQEVANEIGDTESAEAREADLAATAERLLAIPPDQQQLDNPAWVEFLLYDNDGEIRLALRPFFPDESTALMITRLEGNQSIEDEGATSDAVVAAAADLELSNATAITTGAPVLLKDINDYLRGGMISLGGIALAAMALILLVFFNVRWRLLPLLVVTVGVVWAFGLNGYVGIPLTLVTIAALPVLLGVGIDYAIQTARAHRGGGDRRPNTQPDPGGRSAAGRSDAGGHGQRGAGLRRDPVRPDPDDPPVRTAAGGRHRRDLHLVDHQSPRDPGYPRVPLPDEGS